MRGTSDDATAFFSYFIKVTSKYIGENLERVRELLKESDP